MRKLLFLLILAGISLVGCSESEETEEKVAKQIESTQTVSAGVNSIIMKERQNEDYLPMKEIVNPNEIQAVTEIIKNASWEDNMEVLMERPPDYQFSLSSNSYAIWLTPSKDQLEIVAQGQSKYIKLPINESKTLFKILTGNDLGV